ncbi:hypothetical protein KC19_11G120700 [Ceratodon purpureus]|uniref:Uncharacterized protein n=1 Tax=Ceratodon purpureus TaxID=3225 RepID=A0A8T0GGN6_CERPU|nr:hypothetical protein KC19_11G120700 [Ceratodon purpureus]
MCYALMFAMLPISSLLCICVRTNSSCVESASATNVNHHSIPSNLSIIFWLIECILYF